MQINMMVITKFTIFELNINSQSILGSITSTIPTQSFWTTSDFKWSYQSSSVNSKLNISEAFKAIPTSGLHDDVCIA